jgi:hypothetical protein
MLALDGLPVILGLARLAAGQSQADRHRPLHVFMGDPGVGANLRPKKPAASCHPFSSITRAGDWSALRAELFT